MQVDTFTRCISREQYSCVGIAEEECLGLAAVVTLDTAVNYYDGFRRTQHATDFAVQIVQRIFMLREDNEFPKPTGIVFEFRGILQDARQLIPFAVQPRYDNTFGLLLQTFEDQDFGLQFFGCL